MKKLLGTSILLFAVAIGQAQTIKKQSLTKDSSNRFTDSIRSLPPLEVSAVRVSENSPFAKTNLSKAVIQQQQLAQDIPFLLQNTPSVIVHSDAGMGVGYTGLRIRGTDATRINVTLNGIPYNDAESMATYFVDLPDFGSSLSSVQIQRGVGSSTNGAGAFGATINLATNDYRPSKYAQIASSAGSFNSFKNTLQLGTGLINNKFTIDGRISKITSDGYIDRAKSNLNSFYVSGTYWGNNESLRLNVFSGWEKTYQAWYGVPEELLATQRTYNPAGMERAGSPYPNQTDNYQQTHYQAFYNKTINKHLKWNTAIFLTRGKGYYEEYKAGVSPADYGLTNFTATEIDLVRRKWLDNNFYGQIAALSYTTDKNTLTAGGGWTTYDGLHYGTLPYLKNIVQPFNYYFNDAIKKDRNVYIKWEHSLNQNLKTFIDLQYRNVSHTINGFDKNPNTIIDRQFNFFNPKAGITYSKNKLTYYASVAVAHKEPNRDDFEASLIEQPKPEVLYDWEAGISRKSTSFNWNLNLFWMNYKDQLVLTGKINDIGAYTRTNVPKSYRAGVELESNWKISSTLTSSGHITFSKNQIESFTEYIDDYDNGGQLAIEHKNTAISLSPALTAGHTISFVPNKDWQLNFISRYASKQYLDNTQNESRILKAYFLNDFMAQYQLAKKQKWSAQIQLHMNNLFDVKYEPNGYTYSYLYASTITTSNNFYPMAGRNYWLTLKIDFK